MRALLSWLDDRTGYRGLLYKALVEPIPGGAKWRYVWGSTLLFAMAVQFVTGLVLWAGYSPNANGAWESVYYIENSMAGGWMLRGIHHYMAHATMVLLVLHLMQVVVAGAYKAPREVNFWFGLALLHIVMGLSLTGYLLPWDQQGYWATKVATSIASITPVVGPALQKALVGGAEYGHLTLTRFFALHAGVLPGCADRPDRGPRLPVSGGTASRRTAGAMARTAGARARPASPPASGATASSGPIRRCATRWRASRSWRPCSTW